MGMAFQGSRYISAYGLLVAAMVAAFALLIGGGQIEQPAMNERQATTTPQVTGVASESELSRSYVDPQGRFSIRYPEGYEIDSNYITEASLGPDTVFALRVPKNATEGTNLASDSRITVAISGSQVCIAAPFMGGPPPPTKESKITDNGTNYSVASTTGAGAGNRYEVTIYAISEANPCVAVIYNIHYGVIENYSPGIVHEFDKEALLQQFDAIRRTLVIGQQLQARKNE